MRKIKIFKYQDCKVSLLNATPEPAKIVGLAIDITQKRSPVYGNKTASEGLCKFLIKANHGSVLEHVSYSFLIEGASRSFLAQCTRHRIASPTSGSQHYQDMSGCEFAVDESLVEDTVMRVGLEGSLNMYELMIARDVTGQEARQVLPNAARNVLLFTINARSLINFFNLRLCNRNTNEIKIVSGKMYKLALEHFPELFKHVGPDCFMSKHCLQEKMSCGTVWKPETE